MENNLTTPEVVRSIYSQTVDFFFYEGYILSLLDKKYSLNLSNSNLRERNRYTNEINTYINDTLHYQNFKYKKLLSDFESREDVKHFLSPEGVPTFIKYLLELGFPFDVIDNLDKENFLQLITEFQQYPEYSEYETKRRNFINSVISKMDDYLYYNYSGFYSRIPEIKNLEDFFRRCKS